jgi:hypothetical protein
LNIFARANPANCFGFYTIGYPLKAHNSSLDLYWHLKRYLKFKLCAIPPRLTVSRMFQEMDVFIWFCYFCTPDIRCKPLYNFIRWICQLLDQSNKKLSFRNFSNYFILRLRYFKSIFPRTSLEIFAFHEQLVFIWASNFNKITFFYCFLMKIFESLCNEKWMKVLIDSLMEW